MRFRNRKIISFCVLFALLFTSTAQLFAGFSLKHTTDGSHHSSTPISSNLKLDHSNKTSESCIDHCKSISSGSQCFNASTLYQFFTSSIQSFTQNNNQTVSSIIKLNHFKRFTYTLYRPPIQ